MNIYSIPSRLPNVALWLPVVQYFPTDVKTFWKNRLLIFLIRKKGIVHSKGEAIKNVRCQAQFAGAGGVANKGVRIRLRVQVTLSANHK